MAAPTPNPTIRLHDQSAYTKRYQVSIIGKTVSTVVTKDALAVAAWIAEATNRGFNGGHVIGVDVEWKSSDEVDVWNPMGILQLCVGTHCLIYQIFQRTTPIPPALLDFLSHPHNILVVAHTQWKLEKLMKDYGIENMGPCLDLVVMAATRFHRPDLMMNSRMIEVANLVLGISVEKPVMEVAAYRWNKAELTEVEVLYATIDPVLAYEIATVLLYY